MILQKHPKTKKKCKYLNIKFVEELYNFSS